MPQVHRHLCRVGTRQRSVPPVRQHLGARLDAATRPTRMESVRPVHRRDRASTPSRCVGAAFSKDRRSCTLDQLPEHPESWAATSRRVDPTERLDQHQRCVRTLQPSPTEQHLHPAEPAGRLARCQGSAKRRRSPPAPDSRRADPAERLRRCQTLLWSNAAAATS